MGPQTISGIRLTQIAKTGVRSLPSKKGNCEKETSQRMKEFKASTLETPTKASSPKTLKKCKNIMSSLL